MKSIVPTHACFDDVLEYLEMLAIGGTPTREIAQYVVVHAICVAPDGEQFAHAWLEHAGDAVQGGIVDGERIWFAMSLAEFMTRFVVAEQTRYTVVEALAENLRTGHYGPWVEKYRELTHKGDGEPRSWDPGHPPGWMSFPAASSQRRRS
jgi:hypothetical protein